MKQNMLCDDHFSRLEKELSVNRGMHDAMTSDPEELNRRVRRSKETNDPYIDPLVYALYLIFANFSRALGIDRHAPEHQMELLEQAQRDFGCPLCFVAGPCRCLDCRGAEDTADPDRAAKWIEYAGRDTERAWITHTEKKRTGVAPATQNKEGNA